MDVLLLPAGSLKYETLCDHHYKRLGIVKEPRLCLWELWYSYQSMLIECHNSHKQLESFDQVECLSLPIIVQKIKTL